MSRILNPAVYLLAVIYFLVDAVFMAVAKPLADWLARHWVLGRLRAWIESLRPYPALALFAVPVIVLEPVKPVAAYLAATGDVRAGIVILIVGELLKLVLVERLFSITRDKLVSIPAFAWAYGKLCLAKAWLESSDAWRNCRRSSKITLYAVRRLARDLRPARAPRRPAWQSR